MALEGMHVKEKYKIGKRLGEGSFGEVYQGKNIRNEKLVAIKIENCKRGRSLHYNEASVLKELKHKKRFPNIYWEGVENNRKIIVMQLLSKTIKQYINAQGKKPPMTSVVPIFKDMLECLKTLHRNNFIHRDIKPENFMMGRGKDSFRVYLVDFGLSKKFRMPTTREHIRMRENNPLMGTACYASANCHLGYSLSRRDDLESLLYLFVYMLKGKLPWQGLPRKCFDKYFNMQKMKINMSLEEICRGCPQQIVEMMAYVRRLRFTETPDYGYLDRMLDGILRFRPSPSLILDRINSTVIYDNLSGLKASQSRLTYTGTQFDESYSNHFEETTIKDSKLPEFKDRSRIIRQKSTLN